MMTRLRSCAYWLVCCWPVTSLASDVMLELEQVRSRRQQAEQFYAEQLRDCRQKFNVNDCLNQVQVQRSQTLNPLMTQQRALQEEMRRQKAESRKADMEQRRQAHAQRFDSPQPVEAPQTNGVARP